MAKAKLIERVDEKVVTELVHRTVFVDVSEVQLTMTTHEAQLVSLLVSLVASMDGAVLDVSEALSSLRLPNTYSLVEATTIHVTGRRPKEA